MNRVLPNIHQPLIQISLIVYVTDYNWLRQRLSLLKKPGTTKAMIGDVMFEEGHGLCVCGLCVCVRVSLQFTVKVFDVMLPWLLVREMYLVSSL